jgi:hypothetical protein
VRLPPEPTGVDGLVLQVLGDGSLSVAGPVDAAQVEVRVSGVVDPSRRGVEGLESRCCRLEEEQNGLEERDEQRR